MPTATPMIPTTRETNARPFPTTSSIDLILSVIIIERTKQIIEMAEIIHANVINARLVNILLQKELPEALVQSKLPQVCAPNWEEHTFHKPNVPEEALLLKKKLIIFI